MAIVYVNSLFNHSQMHYSLQKMDSVRHRRSYLEPVLGQFQKMATHSITIQKDCGKDDLCIPDLSIQVSQYVMSISYVQHFVDSMNVRSFGLIAVRALMLLATRTSWKSLPRSTTRARTRSTPCCTCKSRPESTTLALIPATPQSMCFAHRQQR